jgi:hypothetical protein
MSSVITTIKNDISGALTPNTETGLLNARTQQHQYFQKQTKGVQGLSYANVRRYQTTDYDFNNNQFYITYIKYAFYLSCIMFLLANATILGYIPTAITALLALLFSIAYIFVFYLEVKRNYVRRPYEWNKFYWNTTFTEY